MSAHRVASRLAEQRGNQVRLPWEPYGHIGVQARTPIGHFWIGDASGSRIGMFEAFWEVPGRVREELGRTRTLEAAKAIAEKKHKVIRSMGVDTYIEHLRTRP